MDWRDVDTGLCPVGATSEVVADRWTMLVLRDIFNGVSRFDDLTKHVGVSTAVLSDRLKKLVNNDLVKRVEYRSEGARARHEYRLTLRGLGLIHIQAAYAQFGNDFLIPPRHRLTELVERGTGETLRLGFLTEDGREVPADQVRLEANGELVQPDPSRR